MTAHIKCVHCGVVFLQPTFYLGHRCAQPAHSIEDLLTRIEQSIRKHPSNPPGGTAS